MQVETSFSRRLPTLARGDREAAVLSALALDRAVCLMSSAAIIRTATGFKPMSLSLADKMRRHLEVGAVVASLWTNLHLPVPLVRVGRKVAQSCVSALDPYRAQKGLIDAGTATLFKHLRQLFLVSNRSVDRIDPGDQRRQVFGAPIADRGAPLHDKFGSQLDKFIDM